MVLAAGDLRGVLRVTSVAFVVCIGHQELLLGDTFLALIDDTIIPILCTVHNLTLVLLVFILLVIVLALIAFLAVLIVVSCTPSLVHPDAISILLQGAHLQVVVVLLALLLLLHELGIVLVSHSLGIWSQADNRQPDCQSLLRLIKLGVALGLVHLVFEVQIEIVKSFYTEDKVGLIDVELGTLHVLAVLGKDRDSE